MVPNRVGEQSAAGPRQLPFSQKSALLAHAHQGAYVVKEIDEEKYEDQFPSPA